MNNDDYWFDYFSWKRNLNKEKKIMITAKEAFELTSGRSEKVKEEKLKLVQDGIQWAIEQENFSTKFSFAQLKPFVANVMETLTGLGYTVSQTGPFVSVSWALQKKTDPVNIAISDLREKYDEEDDDDIYSLTNK
jgi:hypothetical protein